MRLYAIKTRVNTGLLLYAYVHHRIHSIDNLVEENAQKVGHETFHKNIHMQQSKNGGKTFVTKGPKEKINLYGFKV